MQEAWEAEDDTGGAACSAGAALTAAGGATSTPFFPPASLWALACLLLVGAGDADLWHIFGNPSRDAHLLADTLQVRDVHPYIRVHAYICFGLIEFNVYLQLFWARSVHAACCALSNPECMHRDRKWIKVAACCDLQRAQRTARNSRKAAGHAGCCALFAHQRPTLSASNLVAPPQSAHTTTHVSSIVHVLLLSALVATLCNMHAEHACRWRTICAPRKACRI
jgi:hypothetical protein